MLAVQRHREILNRIESQGSAQVNQLAQELAVTEETIRRDLDKLGKEGKLIRIHGGALSMDQERPLEKRKSDNINKKRSIAACAAPLIQEDEVICLDASSSAHELALLVPDLRLTVITNSMTVLSLLSRRRHVTTICTGGIFHKPSQSFIGAMAEEAFARFNINKFFFSSMGIDITRGLSLANHDHARIKQTVIRLAEKAILLADSTKFGVRSVEFFAELNEVNLLITDNKTPAPVLERILESGVEVYQAK